MSSRDAAIRWLRAQERAGETSPARMPRGSLAMLTGQDVRALLAIVACWELYAGGDKAAQRGALAAVRALLPAMQPKCHFLARELIAFAMDWPDRDRVWPLLEKQLSLLPS